MRHTSIIAAPLIALLTAGILLCSAALAQSAPSSLAEQLQAQYKVVKMGSDASGLAVVDPGTVLAIQKGGILGVKPSNMVICPSKFQDGNLKGPNGFCVAMVKQDSRYLQVVRRSIP